MSLWDKIKHGTSSAANTVGHGVSSVANTVGHSVEHTWDATSQEGKEVFQAVEKSGLKMGKGFVDGARIGANYVDEGVQEAGKGFKIAGDYISQHACDIALGGALGAVFVALAADPEEEAAMGSLAVAAALAEGTARDAVIGVAVETIVTIIVSPIYAVPQVKKALKGVPKKSLKDVLAFVITTAVTRDPQLVIGTAGQFVAGLIITTVTGIVCEGKVPAGGPRLWEGAQ